MGTESPIPHPHDWAVTHLGDIALKIGSGATPLGGEEAYLPARSRFALVRSQNVFDRRFDATGLAYISDEQAQSLRGASLQSGDLLLNITGDGVTFARACTVPPEILPACVNQHVAIIRVNPELADAEFVLSYLTHPMVKSYIESFNAGGSRRAITKRHIESFEIALPSLPEQGAIGRVLATLDGKIELNRRISETLQAIARALFKSWFVNFDPARARAQGCEAKLEDNLFPDSLEESALGEIPRGWGIANLGEIVEFAYGKALKEEDRRPGPYPVFGSNGQIGWHNEKLVSGPGIVVGRKGNPGVVTWAPTDFFAIDTAFYIVPRPAYNYPHFLFYALRDQHLETLSADSAVPGLNRNLAYMSKQLLPPQSILDAFEKRAVLVFRRRHESELESRTLATIRDTLLPKLISGELRIKDAERIVGAHT